MYQGSTANSTHTLCFYCISLSFHFTVLEASRVAPNATAAGLPFVLFCARAYPRAVNTEAKAVLQGTVWLAAFPLVRTGALALLLLLVPLVSL